MHFPKTIEQVQAVVKKSDNIRAVGSWHSFNKIADSKENQICLQEMNKVVALDKKPTL